MKTKSSRKCTCTKRKAAPKTEVTFTVHAEKGKAVYLSGEFNGWDPAAKKMSYKARSGIYAATVKLAAGEIPKPHFENIRIIRLFRINIRINPPGTNHIVGKPFLLLVESLVNNHIIGTLIPLFLG